MGEEGSRAAWSLKCSRDEDERWAAIEDAPFNPRTGARQWTPDGAKRVVGQRVDRPVTVDEKVQAVADLTRDDEVAAQVATDLLKRPAVTELVMTFRALAAAPAVPEWTTSQRPAQVDEWTRQGVLRRGLTLGCEECPAFEFYPLEEVTQQYRCRRCDAANELIQARCKTDASEPEWT